MNASSTTKVAQWPPSEFEDDGSVSVDVDWNWWTTSEQRAAFARFLPRDKIYADLCRSTALVSFPRLPPRTHGPD